MMMKCLDTGGLKAVYSRPKDVFLNEKYARNDYHPNPEGFYELGPKEFNAPGFPEIYSGRLIKALHWRLKDLPEFRYKIIFMERDPVEIEVSYLKMFRRRPPFVLHRYDELLQEIYSMISQRTDMNCITVRHRDLIEKPHEIFKTIQKNGWPVTDIKRAVSAINPRLYRSKKNDLESVRQSIPGLRTDLPEVLTDRKPETAD